MRKYLRLDEEFIVYGVRIWDSSGMLVVSELRPYKNEFEAEARVREEAGRGGTYELELIYRFNEGKG